MLFGDTVDLVECLPAMFEVLDLTQYEISILRKVELKGSEVKAWLGEMTQWIKALVS